MTLIWPIIRNTAVNAWEELFYLLVFNIITLIAIGIGPIIIMMGLQEFLLLSVVGVLFLAAVPPALFGLFGAMHQIGEGNAIKLQTYFRAAREWLKPAYIWGGINLVVFLLLVGNIAFYRRFDALWAFYVSVFFLGITLLWTFVQLLTLSLYPKLVSPNFKLATRNALALIALQPIPIFMLLVLSVVLILLGLSIPLIGGLLSISLVALLVNMTTVQILKKVELKEHEAGNTR